MKLIEEELTYKLRGGLFSVHNEVGIGRSEEAYHRAFCLWMSENQISFRTKPVYPLHLSGVKILDLIPDLVVEDSLVIELKAKPYRLASGDCVQLYNYLKRTGIGLGLLVNMGLDRVHIERHLHDVAETQFRIFDKAGNENPVVQKIHDMLTEIYSEHSTGYSAAIMERLMNAAYLRANFEVIHKPTIENIYKGQSIGNSSLDCVVIDHVKALSYTCLYDDNEFNLSRTRSFLRALNLENGIAVNFGKRILEAKSI